MIAPFACSQTNGNSIQEKKKSPFVHAPFSAGVIIKKVQFLEKLTVNVVHAELISLNLLQKYRRTIATIGQFCTLKFVLL